ncbi:paraquat-inducible protein A [Pseudooceanicola sp. MF1-13]|uniref:paraquat-inducible protein A n=1 Tax=Pseudooceanicola sp. MF1-13 TaxID=3379095 RepID=UPI003892B5D9
MHRWLFYLNLSLLILFPISWFAPLVRAGLLPLFGLSEISVISGIASLWRTDMFLAVIVALFALVAPMAKVITLALIQSGRAPDRWRKWLGFLSKLAMADIFLIALYITLAKGMGVGRVETAWGLYLFSSLVIVSFLLSHCSRRVNDGNH